jgi:Zn-dependent peptidase ImmA (M78 family)
MSVYEKIRSQAKALVKKHGTRNPFIIADEVGIHLRYRNDFSKLKGFYKVIDRSRFIFINAELDEYEQKIVCAHELGHDMLHRTLAKFGILQEMTLCDMKSRPEYEANVFAADILLDDDEVFALAKDGYTEVQIASELCTDVNLLLIKMNEMNKAGYDFNLSQVPR